MLFCIAKAAILAVPISFEILPARRLRLLMNDCARPATARTGTILESKLRFRRMNTGGTPL